MLRPSPDGEAPGAAAPQGDPPRGLDRIGYDADDLQAIRNALEAPDGLVLLVGPPRSGRSSALAAMRQYRALRGAGATLLPAIATPGVAQRAVQAAQAGHLVLSKMALSRACSVVAELQRLQVPLALLLDALCLAIGHRRVRRLCPQCAVPAGREEVRAALASALNTWLAGCMPQPRQAAAAGCARCGYSGYDGTLLAYELLDVDQRARGLIASVTDPVELERLLLGEGRSIWDRGLKQVAEGATSFVALRAAVRQPH